MRKELIILAHKKKEHDFIPSSELPVNSFALDFLTITVHDLLPALLLKIFCDCVSNPDVDCANFTVWETGTQRGYNRSYRFLDEKYMSISWHDERPQAGICLNLTGKGCSFLRHEDYVTFIKELRHRGLRYNVTRVDIAFDDYHREIPVNEMIERLRVFASGDWERPPVSTHTDRESIQFHTVFFNDITGTNVTFGSRRSSGRFRLYDKRAEQKIDNLEYWYRLELELRKEKALVFMNLLVDGEEIHSLFTEVLFSMVRFIEKNSVNVCDCRTSPFYEDFILLLANYSLNCIFRE